MNINEEKVPDLKSKLLSRPVFLGPITLGYLTEKTDLHPSADEKHRHYFQKGVNPGIIVYPDKCRAERHCPGAFLSQGEQHCFRRDSCSQVSCMGHCEKVEIAEIPLNGGITLIRQCAMIRTPIGSFPERVYYIKS